MAVRNDDKIQLGEVHTKRFDVVLECRRIVSSVEEYALTVVFDESRKTPVLGDSFVIGERVIENRNAILGDGMRGNCKYKETAASAKSPRMTFIDSLPSKASKER
jgi:hypothetical protein